MRCLRRLLSCLLTFVFATSALSMAQVVVATGTPPFGSFGGGPFDMVNLGNLNVHFTIPVIHKAGRGVAFTYDLSYDSSVWTQVSVNGVLTWQPASNWGWRGQTEAAVGYVTYLNHRQKCPIAGDGYSTWRDTYVYHDMFGVPHAYSSSAITSDCNSGSSGFSETASDGSGYTLNVDDTGLGNTVVNASGVVHNIPGGTSGAGTKTDANGNQLSVNSSGVFTDTLGTSALTITGGAPNPLNFTYTSPANTQVSYAMNYTSYNVKTNFGCNVSEYTGTNSLVSSIRLPDGSQYTFSYEQTPGNTGYVTGRLAQVTLPTGGTISYSYTGGSNGILCTDGSAAGLTRTLNPGGAWTYARANVSGSEWKTVVNDPKAPANQTVVYFQLDSATGLANTHNFYETQRQIYQGNSPGTLLSTTISCYNGQNVGTPSNCPTTAVATPILRQTVFRYLPDSTGVAAETDSTYDGFGLIHEVDDYDYGLTGGAVGPLLRKTVTNYASLGNGIVDRPSSVVIEDAANNPKASTAYTYDDAGTLTATSGIPQHISITGSRGNLTSFAAQANGTTTLYRKFTYYDTGTLNTSTDVSTSSSTNGATTTYNYTSGTASCYNAFPTSISEPASLSRSMTWNCTGSVLTSLTDENGKTSSTSYTDPYFWRPFSSSDAAGNTATFTYSPDANTSLPTQTESTLLFNSNNSVVDTLTTVDGFGRVMLSQRKQGPSATIYDTTEIDYDIAGCGVSRTTLAYSGTQGQTNSSAPGSTTTHDGACRVSAVSDSGGGSTTYTYAYNDTYTTVGPAPSGENAKRKQLEYGGLGWLKSVCEITAGTSSAPAGTCSQSSNQTGYWTTYNYDLLGNQQTVTQNAQAASNSQQSRDFIYDMLGRITSEANPESGTTTYAYDSLPSGCYQYGDNQSGNLTGKTDANGNAACYHYDALHRLIDVGVTAPSGGGYCKRFRYDNTTGVLGSRPSGVTIVNTLGRLAEAETDTCGAWPPTTTMITDEWFSYTPRGETSDTFEMTPNSAGYHHFNVSYWANGVPNTVKEWVPNGTLSYQYSNVLEGEGRISGVLDGGGGAVLNNVTYTTSGTSQPIGSLTGMTFAYSGDSDAYSYDVNTGRMTQYQFNVGSGGSSTPAFVQSTYGAQQNIATSFSTAFKSNVTSGNMLFVTFANDMASSISSISDTLGNTYTALPLIVKNGYQFQAFYAFSKASGADTVKGTYSGSGATYIQETLAEYSNVSALDAHAENSGTNSQPSTTTTTTASSDLAIGYVTDSYTTWTGETGWNLRTTASGIRAALQDTIAANPGSITSTFNTVSAWNAGIAAFKPTSSSGGSNKGVLTWNANGTLRSLAITDSINPADTQTCNYGTSSVAGYDDLGRLANVNCGSAWSQSFTYDPFGNITKSGSLSWMPGYSSSTNRYTLTGTSYDSDGHVLNDTSHAYTWNAYDTPTSVDSVGLLYDAFDREVEINDGSTHYQIIYSPIDNARITAQGNTTPYQRVPLLMGAFAQWNSGVPHYSHADWLGSIRESSSTSRTSLGNVAHAPFGESYAVAGNPDQKFAGISEFYFANTYDATFRKYNSTQGRWLSPDPAGIAAVNPADPQTWNRYSYVANRPLSYVDPLGLFMVIPGGGGGGDDGGCAYDACVVAPDPGAGGSGDICFFMPELCSGSPAPPIRPPLAPPGTKNPQKAANNTPCKGWSFGGTIGANAEIGGLPGGPLAAGSASISAGVFNNNFSAPGGTSLAATATGGGFVGSGDMVVPNQDNTKPDAGGLYGGLGFGAFISNAGNPAAIGGHFATYSFDTPIVSVQFATGGGIWSLSVTLGPGFALGASKMTTNTVAKPLAGSGTCVGSSSGG